MNIYITILIIFVALGWGWIVTISFFFIVNRKNSRKKIEKNDLQKILKDKNEVIF
jgi:uncharacterized membrane protein